MGMYVTHLVRREGIHFMYTNAENAMNMEVCFVSLANKYLWHQIWSEALLIQKITFILNRRDSEPILREKHKIEGLAIWRKTAMISQKISNSNCVTHFWVVFTEN